MKRFFWCVVAAWCLDSGWVVFRHYFLGKNVPESGSAPWYTGIILTSLSTVIVLLLLSLIMGFMLFFRRKNDGGT